MKKIEAVLFDLGGVLIRLNYQFTIDEFKKFGLDNFEAFYTQKQQSELFDKFETGQISTMHFVNELLRVLPKGVSANQVVHAWNKMILDFPKISLDILKQVRNHHKVFLLSNTNEIHMEKVKREWQLITNEDMSSYFDQVFLSHEINMRKPEIATFLEVSIKMQIPPQNILFIDDSKQHIEGAKQAGMNAELLNHIDELALVLQKWEVI